METKETNGEAINNWKQIVETLWSLNYISVSFKGCLPRLGGMSQSLDDLGQVIPSIQKKGTTNVLKDELEETLRQFAQIIELLSAGQERMNGLLRQLESHRVNIK